MIIKCATTAAEMAVVRELFREYETYLNVDLCFQSFEEELAGLPGKYAPPGGELLLAMAGDRALGCVAVRRLDAEACEMKRLYVRPEARGSGLGRRLAVAIIAAARKIGYRQMRLDTLDKLTEALQLYATLGFRRTRPYYQNPLPGVRYLALTLAGGSDGRGPAEEIEERQA